MLSGSSPPHLTLTCCNVAFMGLLLKSISEATTTAEGGSASNSWGPLGWEQPASKFQLQEISVGEYVSNWPL